MLAYATPTSEVRQWVPAHGEPMPDDLRRALADPSVTLSAWNAPFEAQIMRHVLKIDIPIWRWMDVMALAYSLALPGSLDQCGKVVGLPQDKQKMSRGKLLVRKFCVPRKPSKHKPHTRCARETDPEEWQEFLEYNRQDVEAERSIYRRIKKFQMPDHEWDLWHLDQKINDAGIPINTKAVEKAVRLAQETTKKDLAEMAEITGLANPNSGAQLLPWLRAKGYWFEDLKKGHVERAANWIRAAFDDGRADLMGLDEDVLRVLELRLRVSKSSVKKYPALLAATDDDGNLRGCHQFAGAGRTWRWCLPAYTPVLVKRPGGRVCTVPITDVRLSDLVWDGWEWVRHEGVVYSGVRETVCFDGVVATPAHRVYINSWLQVPLSVAKKMRMEVWRGCEPVFDIPTDFAERAQLHRPDQDGLKGTVENALHQSPDAGQASPAPRCDKEARPGGFPNRGSGERPVERRSEGRRGPLDQGPVPRDEPVPRRGGWTVRKRVLLAGTSEQPRRFRGVCGETLNDPEAPDGGKPGVARGDCRRRPGVERREPAGSLSLGHAQSPRGHARGSVSPRAIAAARPPVREIRRAAFHRLCPSQEGARELPEACRPSETMGAARPIRPESGGFRWHESALEPDVIRAAAEGAGLDGEGPGGSEGEIRSGPRALGSCQGTAAGGHTPVLGGEASREGEPTYDIVNAGPRNRFTAWGRVVSNSGRRFQPQNLSKPAKYLEDKVPEVAHDIEHLSAEEMWAKYDDPDDHRRNTMEALVAGVRPMVQAPDGTLLVDADLSAIENVVLGWLADDDKILRVFRNGLDPYIDFAQDMFKMSYSAIEAEVKAGNKSKRTTAKPGVLGCGYLLGPGEARENPNTGEMEATGLLGYGWSMGVDLTPEMAKLSVDTFRAKFKRVVEFWYDLDRACRRAITTKQKQTCGYLVIDRQGPFMRIRLPSGRYLHYWKPRIEQRRMPWKDADGRPVYRDSITYEQIENGQWRRVTTHPGKLTENVTQAVARDLLAHGMMLAARLGLDLRLHVHDQAVAVSPEWRAQRDLETLIDCLTTRPKWADDRLPLKAAGFTSPVFLKD